VKGSIPNPLEIFAAPQNVVQPILPGWVFGNTVSVTEQNSSAPDTERDIVAMHSYGRQLGRLIDAVILLIQNLPKTDQDARPFEELMKLSQDIEDIKSRAATRGIDRIAADLATLKEAKPAEYDRVAAKLREVLKES
jgi:hypothetical protein